MKNYQFLFGPVPSRRFGLSLGLDLVPLKICSLNCLYCECGKTSVLTLERKEYSPVQKILEELNDFMASENRPDCITLTGSGEPTLNSGFGELALRIKEQYPEIRLVLLTNGTLFADEKVRMAAGMCDTVKISVDAVSEDLFRKINLPPSGFDLKAMLDGIRSFSETYQGKLWIEIFIVPGLNDHPDEISRLRRYLAEIGPDKIQLNTLDRPAAFEGIQKASPELLKTIQREMGLPQVEIIARFESSRTGGLKDRPDEEMILNILKRRPCTLEDLMSVLGSDRDWLHGVLQSLTDNGKIRIRKEVRGEFYQITV
jgi:wyosine [tRNA(Phe)-imidazoG37] synthetase (radical SAM superfamily)